MELVDGDDFFQRILVVESADYIEPLHNRFPMARIFFVTTKESDAQKFPYVESFLLDYREEQLPFEKEFFDAIIGDLTLEVVIHPQDIAAGFSSYLKQTGCWLTSFRNVRHWKVLEKLMRGAFGAIVSRLYTNTEFIRLLVASFYKDFRCGFDNLNDDLQVEFWLVKASRSMPELALLKSVFSKEIRSEFSRLLHRIEYDIDTEDSVKKFWRFFDTEGIFTDYAAAFIRSVVIHRERFYRNVKKYSSRPELEEIIAECESLYYFDNGNRLL